MAAVAIPCQPSEQELELGVLLSQWLGPAPEEEVLKAGLDNASAKLGEEGLLDFPRRPNGSPLLMRQGFFERMLRGDLTLQNCAAADVSAAEADVKRLNLQQLLRLRRVHMDFVPSGSQASKASFLGLVDRCTMSLFAERLLTEPKLALNDGQRALAMRVVVLIYGADRTLRQAGQPVGTDWWQLMVGSERRFLHLPTCTTGTLPPPGEHAMCYRIYTSAAPRDPRKTRVFRWQVLEVESPETWTEDPVNPEQPSGKSSSMKDSRARIMQIHSRKMNYQKDDVNFVELARSTDDFNGAQLKAVCVEAGMEALRRGATQLCHEDYMAGINSVQSKKKSAFNYYA